MVKHHNDVVLAIKFGEHLEVTRHDEEPFEEFDKRAHAMACGAVEGPVILMRYEHLV